MKLKTIITLKNELKALAISIRETKNRRKQDKRGDKSLGELEWIIQKDKYEFRLRHIAYCLLRGRTYEQVEKPSEYNKPNMKKVESLLASYKESIAKEQITADVVNG